MIDGIRLCCVVLEFLGLTDLGLLRGDVSCRGRIGLGDGQGLSTAVLCCRVSAGLGEWRLTCARSHCLVVPTVEKGHELLVIPCLCSGFACLVECEGAPGARCRRVAGTGGIWGLVCFVFSRGFVVMEGLYFTPLADVCCPGFIGAGGVLQLSLILLSCTGPFGVWGGKSP